MEIVEIRKMLQMKQMKWKRRIMYRRVYLQQAEDIIQKQE
jgi:hypothetical protein